MHLTALDLLNNHLDTPIKSRGNSIMVTIEGNPGLDIAAAATATAVLTTVDISKYRYGVIVISGLVAETIAITGLIGAAGNVATGVIEVETTGGVKQTAAALANGTYYLRDFALHALVFTKSSTVNPAVVTVMLKG